MTNGEIILKLIKDLTGVELELGDEFDINYILVKVTQEGLVYASDGKDHHYITLQEFVKGIKKIKPKPKFPKEGTKYYCILKDEHIYDRVFSKYITIDVLNYKTGNFFLTIKEAEQNKEKIMKILNSPERFELK